MPGKPQDTPLSRTIPALKLTFNVGEIPDLVTGILSEVKAPAPQSNPLSLILNKDIISGPHTPKPLEYISIGEFQRAMEKIETSVTELGDGTWVKGNLELNKIAGEERYKARSGEPLWFLSTNIKEYRRVRILSHLIATVSVENSIPPAVIMPHFLDCFTHLFYDAPDSLATSATHDRLQQLVESGINEETYGVQWNGFLVDLQTAEKKYNLYGILSTAGFYLHIMEKVKKQEDIERWYSQFAIGQLTLLHYLIYRRYNKIIRDYKLHKDGVDRYYSGTPSRSTLGGICESALMKPGECLDADEVRAFGHLEALQASSGVEIPTTISEAIAGIMPTGTLPAALPHKTHHLPRVIGVDIPIASYTQTLGHSHRDYYFVVQIGLPAEGSIAQSLYIIYSEGSVFVTSGAKEDGAYLSLADLVKMNWLEKKYFDYARYILAYCYLDQHNRKDEINMTQSYPGTVSDQAESTATSTDSALLELLGKLKPDDITLALSLLISGTNPTRLNVSRRVRTALDTPAQESVFSQRSPAIFARLPNGIPSSETRKIAEKVGQSLFAYTGRVDHATFGAHKAAAAVRDTDGSLSWSRLSELPLRDKIHILSDAAASGTQNPPIYTYMGDGNRQGFTTIGAERVDVGLLTKDEIYKYFFYAITPLIDTIEGDLKNAGYNSEGPDEEIRTICHILQYYRECVLEIQDISDDPERQKKEMHALVKLFRSALCERRSEISREKLFSLTGFAYLMDCVGIRVYGENGESESQEEGG